MLLAKRSISSLINFGREEVRGRGGGRAMFPRNVLERIIYYQFIDQAPTCREHIVIPGRLISLWKGEFNINSIQETRS